MALIYSDHSICEMNERFVAGNVSICKSVNVCVNSVMETNLGTGRKMKKKRRLIIDEQKLIPSDTMRAQLRRAADLVIPLELAPPTKRLMEWKDIGGVEKLLILPGRHIGPTRLRQVMHR